MIEKGEKLAGDLPKGIHSGWYFSKVDIENISASRKDGIDQKKEAELRLLYCKYLQELGLKLGLPQMTIATALIICHRFYLHQSLAKNDWQTVATVCIFLASKIEDTPVALDKVTVMSYKMIHQKDPDAPDRIRRKDIFQKQKELILIGERLVLKTIRFDFNIQHPYKSLVHAMNKFGIVQKNVRQMAWSFINDWLCSTLCMQYKPHYIAAGSLYVTAKLQNVKLPSGRGYVWWHEFDVAPHQLNAVIQDMFEIVGYNKKQVKRSPFVPLQPKVPAKTPKPVEEASSSPDSCLSHSSRSHDFEEADAQTTPSDVIMNNTGKERPCAGRLGVLRCQANTPENPEGIVDDVNKCGVAGQDRQQADKSLASVGKINLDKIRTLRKIRKEKETGKAVEGVAFQASIPEFRAGATNSHEAMKSL